MNKNRFLVLFSILIAANAVAYFSSCRQDEAATITPKPTGDMPAVDRACTDDDYCSYVITASADCTVELCGDLLIWTNTCTVGCGTNGTDHSIIVPLTMGTPYTFCVQDDGSVCVYNPPAAPLAINVTVEVAGTTPVPVSIGIGNRSCFSSDDDCSFTDNNCF